MAKQFKVSESMKSLLEQTARKQGTQVVTLADFLNHGISNPMDSIFEVGVTLYFPTEDELEPGRIDFENFTVNGTTRKAPYIWVDGEKDGKAIQPKKLFISQLIRNVPEYTEENGDFVRGESVHSDTKLYEKLSTFRNAGDILKYCLGKTIKVTEIKRGKTARYTGTVITGLREYNMACFEEA